MATLSISFTEPTPAPANGYEVLYRVAGSGSAYTSQLGASSPINITGVSLTSDYEGTIKAICDGELGVYSAEVPWTTVPPEPPPPSATLVNTDPDAVHVWWGGVDLGTVDPDGGFVTVDPTVTSVKLFFGAATSFTLYYLDGSGTELGTDIVTNNVDSPVSIPAEAVTINIAYT
jgi:hypothetical protein